MTEPETGASVTYLPFREILRDYATKTTEADTTADSEAAKQHVIGVLRSKAQETYLREVYAPEMAVWQQAVELVASSSPDILQNESSWDERFRRYCGLSKFFYRLEQTDNVPVESAVRVIVGTSSPLERSIELYKGYRHYDQWEQPFNLGIRKMIGGKDRYKGYPKLFERISEIILEKANLVEVELYARPAGNDLYDKLPSSPEGLLSTDLIFKRPTKSFSRLVEPIPSDTTLEEVQDRLCGPYTINPEILRLEGVLENLDSYHPMTTTRFVYRHSLKYEIKN